jgi:endonuclease-3
METEEFLKVLDILEKNIPKNAPSNILKNSHKRTPYTILIATLLSFRTKDEITARVCKELFKIADTPKEMIKIPLQKLEEIIRPTGMYRKKARNIIEVSKTLVEKFDSKVPNSKSELLSIKGVGDKTANILLNSAFNTPSIAVDTHVHRIPNLLGFIDTKTPKETEIELHKRVPKEYWHKLNHIIVSFGQTTCTPINPKCESCAIREFCKLDIIN